MNDMKPLKKADLVVEPVPEETYNLRVDKADYVAKPKSATASPYIACQLTITGPYERYLGRRIFVNYPVEGSGSSRLGALLDVTGHPDDFELTDPAQLIGLESSAAVGIESGTAGHPDKNVIKRHMPLL